jgi:protein tyrosine/serine phosphatase
MSLSSTHMLLFVLALPALANPLPGSLPQGIKNFQQVDSRVYRGAQPTEDGIKYLAKIGVKTVIDLRAADERADAEEVMVTAAGMKYVNVPMSGRTAPTEAQISEVLGILERSGEGGGPVFVHCKRGADRTGVVIASYRIDSDGWDNAHALSEAKERGMASDQFPRMSYIRTFQAHAFQAHALQAQTVDAKAAVVQ